MRRTYRISALVLLALCATQASAAEPIDGCVDLTGSQQINRYGGKAVLVADGGAFYKLDLGSTCDQLATSTRYTLSSDGAAGRVCPTGTRVRLNSGSCAVRTVERIDQSTYEGYRRRR